MAKAFEDILVVYPSDIDQGRFVAHSLRTDQIGVGDNVVEALVELLQAIQALAEEAARDESVVVAQEAPAEVLERLRHAEKIPDNIWQKVEELFKRPEPEQPGPLMHAPIPMKLMRYHTATAAWHDVRTDAILVKG